MKHLGKKFLNLRVMSHRSESGGRVNSIVLPKKMDIERDVFYRETDGWDPCLNTLDIYHGHLGGREARKPVVVFVHGGDWTGGNKLCVHAQGTSIARCFVALGAVFVAINFRLVQSRLSPAASVIDQLDDIAKAIKWVSVNIRRYGGDASQVTLIGYSSGAHLVALLVCDSTYLRYYRLPVSVIRQVICLDGAHFDIPLAIRLLAEQDLGLNYQDLRIRKLENLMGRDEAEQRRLSPACYTLTELRQTRFLLLSAGLQGGSAHAFSRLMNEQFSLRLKDAGVAVQHRHLPMLDHEDLLYMRDASYLNIVEMAISNLKCNTP